MTIDYRKQLLEDLAHEDEAIAHIEAAIQSGDLERILMALRDVGEAQRIKEMKSISSEARSWDTTTSLRKGETIMVRDQAWYDRLYNQG